MALHDSPTGELETITEKAPRRFNPGPLAQRLSHLLLGTEPREGTSSGRRFAAWIREERGSLGEDVIPRFPLVKHGYACEAVDVYVDELERDIAELDRELVDLRARTPGPGEVESEFKRIGEQTSSVLIAAHEQQQEILRASREEADRTLAEATARANAITAEAEARVRELEVKGEAAQRQRDRLLDDARTVSAELAALADAAQERIPALAAGG